MRPLVTRRGGRLTAALAATVVVAACGGEPPQSQRTPQAIHTLFGPVTWYSAVDNDPPGSRVIAHPVLHERAGGTGTYDDPITFATEYDDTYPVGTRIYMPYLRKYFIREDDCQCRHAPHHVDLWMAAPHADRRVLRCEVRMGFDTPMPIVRNPHRYFPVDPTPMYAPCHTKTY